MAPDKRARVFYVTMHPFYPSPPNREWFPEAKMNVKYVWMIQNTLPSLEIMAQPPFPQWWDVILLNCANNFPPPPRRRNTTKLERRLTKCQGLKQVLNKWHKKTLFPHPSVFCPRSAPPGCGGDDCPQKKTFTPFLRPSITHQVSFVFCGEEEKRVWKGKQEQTLFKCLRNAHDYQIWRMCKKEKILSVEYSTLHKNIQAAPQKNKIHSHGS